MSTDEEEENRKSFTASETPEKSENPSKTLTFHQANSSSALCHTCQLSDGQNNSELIQCSSCQHYFHSSCLEISDNMLLIIKTYPWQCTECKSCLKCNKTHDEVSNLSLFD